MGPVTHTSHCILDWCTINMDVVVNESELHIIIVSMTGIQFTELALVLGRGLPPCGEGKGEGEGEGRGRLTKITPHTTDMMMRLRTLYCKIL